MDKNQLEIQLKELQDGADTQLGLHRQSQEQLWSLLANSYLWWREASKESGYLESLYEQRKIGSWKSKDNLTNFSPLIRLVWNMEEPTKADRATVSQWNKALQRVDEHYIQNPDGFVHNPKGKLSAYIEQNGGIAGLITNDGALAEAGNPTQRIRSSSSAISVKSKAEIALIARTNLKAQAKGIGTANVRETVRVGGDSLLVLLARREKTGRITVLGSSNDPIQIDTVASHAIKNNLANLPSNLRALAEVVATQAFPSHALPSSREKRSKWHQTKYSDLSDIWEGDLEKWDKQGRGRRLRSSKRLLFRGNERDIIFSGTRVSVSPVTRCILNDPLIPKGDTLYLRTIERVNIEQWIETKETMLLRVEPKLQLKPAEQTDSAKYKLAVTNTVSGFTKFLHFYNHVPNKSNTNYQVEFRRDKFKPEWKVNLRSEWFSSLRQIWADRWFAELGRFNQIVRSHNAIVELKVTAKKTVYRV